MQDRRRMRPQVETEGVWAMGRYPESAGQNEKTDLAPVLERQRSCMMYSIISYYRHDWRFIECNSIYARSFCMSCGCAGLYSDMPFFFALFSFLRITRVGMEHTKFCRVDRIIDKEQHNAMGFKPNIISFNKCFG